MQNRCCTGSRTFSGNAVFVLVLFIGERERVHVRSLIEARAVTLCNHQATRLIDKTETKERWLTNPRSQRHLSTVLTCRPSPLPGGSG